MARAIFGDDALEDTHTILATGITNLLILSRRAPTHLTAIARGDVYLFFVNDHFVGGCRDGSRRAGHIGVYLGLGTLAGAFSDFAVYRAS